jgi:beta-N-acetylhexosaminidase
MTASLYHTGQSPGAGVIAEAARRARQHTLVIVLTGNADTNPAQRTLVAELARSNRRLITIATRRPYDAAWYRSDVHLLTYSTSTPSAKAAVRVIFGEVRPTGRLPVDIQRPGQPIVHPFGFGLGYD